MATYRWLIRDRSDIALKLEHAAHRDDASARRWGLEILARQPDRATCEIWDGNRLVYSVTGWPPSI
jgi:hypothetical protein